MKEFMESGKWWMGSGKVDEKALENPKAAFVWTNE